MALKLNMGCGQNWMEGFENVDKYPPADRILDIENGNWPWPDGSVDEIVFFHSLEHMKNTVGIMCEAYRVCKDGAVVKITCPHPRHNNFIDDPTHVAAITPQQFVLLSKKACADFAKQKNSSTPLAFQLDVDFEMLEKQYILDPRVATMIQSRIEDMKARGVPDERIKIEQTRILEDLILSSNNIVQDFSVTLRVVKHG